MLTHLKSIIERAWDERTLLNTSEVRNAVEEVMAALDSGQVRVASPSDDDTWQVPDWVKKAILLYFPLHESQTIEIGPFEFYDKIPLKKNFAAQKFGWYHMP